MRKIKVAIYIRVSTKHQVEEGYSLNAQRERLEKICETNGYIIYKVYSDEGKSGKNTNRPALQEMIQDMKDGKFDKILVMKLDRISRSVIDLEILIQQMQEYKVDFESASEKIDTGSSFGMMFIRLLAIFAQFERERITERVNDAFEAMVSEGKAISGKQPIGFKIEDGKVIIDEDKREIIEFIFDNYEKNRSIRKTMLYANEKFGLTYNNNTLARIITNPMFYGHYRGNDNYCPAYMTKERFDNIQRIKEDRKCVKYYNSDRVYLFSGLLVDIRCGNKLVGNYKKNPLNDTILYRCGKHNLEKQCTSNRIVNEKLLESYLLDNLDKLIKDYFDSQDKQFEKVRLVDNSKKIAAIKAEMKRTTNSYNKGRMSEEDYDKDYTKLEKELFKLESEPTKKINTKLLDISNTDWKTVYSNLTKDNKQIFWSSIIDKIEIDPNNFKEFNTKYIRVYFI